MLNQILAIAQKELKVIFHDRGAMVVLFLLPIAFILVMTTALQGAFDTGSNDNPIRVLVVNQDKGLIAARVIADLETVSGLELMEQENGQPLIRTVAEDMIVHQEAPIALIFPPDFSTDVLAGQSAQQAKVTFVTDPTVGSQILSPVEGVVSGAIDREVAQAQAPGQMRQLFDQMAAQAPAEQAGMIQALGSQVSTQMQAGQSSSSTDASVTYEVVSPAKYKAVQYPTSAQQNVPGYTIYGVFFIIQTIALSMFREKNEGTFRRLQAAPLSQVALLIGKMLPYFLVNLVQIALMFAFGVLVFHIGLGHDFLALALLSLASAAAATGLGLLLAALTRTQEQAGSLGTLLAVMLSVLGGSMIPVYVMPNFMQNLSKFTPQSWALNGFLDVMVRGLGVSSILPAVGMLLLFAAAFWGVAVWRFRFE